MAIIFEYFASLLILEAKILFHFDKLESVINRESLANIDLFLLPSFSLTNVN